MIKVFAVPTIASSMNDCLGFHVDDLCDRGSQDKLDYKNGGMVVFQSQ